MNGMTDARGHCWHELARWQHYRDPQPDGPYRIEVQTCCRCGGRSLLVQKQITLLFNTSPDYAVTRTYRHTRHAYEGDTRYTEPCTHPIAIPPSPWGTPWLREPPAYDDEGIDETGIPVKQSGKREEHKP